PPSSLSAAPPSSAPAPLSLHDALPILVKPIERILNSGLFGPWDRPDIKGIAPDELPPAINPSRQPLWGQDSFEFFPNFTLLIWRSEEHTLNSSHVKISYAVFCSEKRTR